MNNVLAYNSVENKIQGWMSDRELEWLYEQAQNMDSIVEIGCWKGRSSHALLSGCKGTVYCVDHFQGNPTQRENEHKEATKKDISQDFLKNVGHFPNLKLLKMDSVEASKQFENEFVDMVFIDGDHFYDAIVADLKAWTPKCKKLICGHDFNEQSVVNAVVEQRYANWKNHPSMSIWEARL